MGFNCGIIGLPNVGKSTLFNAITKTAAAASANYPFCTIEPNIGRVPVPDPRLLPIADFARSKQTIPTQLDIKDIAGLVRGASKGEGLGNQFLGAIREVDAILHVVRCFDDENVTHVEGGIDPIRDIELVETELLLADIEMLERQQVNLTKKARGQDTDAKAKLEWIDVVLPTLQEGDFARSVALSDTHRSLARSFNLLTSKPMLFVCNVNEEAAAIGNAYSACVSDYADKVGSHHVVVSAEIEADLVNLVTEDQVEFLAGMNLDEPGLNRVVREGYALLDLVTFFTAGPKETRAWTVVKGAKAPDAAGAIHSDFARGFIAAEIIDYQDYVTFGGEQACREHGKLRLEGRDYTIKDGDICHFRFNV